MIPSWLTTLMIIQPDITAQAPQSFREVLWGIISLGVMMGAREATYWITKFRERGNGGQSANRHTAELVGSTKRLAHDVERMGDKVESELRDIRDICLRIEGKL